MRLTPLSKILIFLLVLGALYFLASQFIDFGELVGAGGDKNATEQVSSSNSATNSNSNAATKGTENAAKASTSSSAAAPTCRFNYNSPKVASGKLKGVVELGATGFNSFVVKMDKSKNWELKKSDFGNSMVHENMASASDIRTGLKNYINNMLEYGVSGKEIHFVVSSGARTDGKVKKIVAELKSMGYVVNQVTPEQEATYGFLVAVPAAYRDKAYMVDIGSGNTKIAWMKDGQLKTQEGPGAKYYQKSTSDADVTKELTAKSKLIPKGVRQNCFIIGGAPYKMAKIDRKDKERFTALRKPRGYEQELSGKLDGEKNRCGLNIYKSIYDVAQSDCVVFDWDANFTIGFLLDLNY